MAHPRVWHLTAAFFPTTIGFYIMTFWMPQMIKAGFSRYSNTTVGVLVMIPYLVALAAMILVARSSDHRIERRYHAAIPLIVGAVSFALLGMQLINSSSTSVPLWCLVAEASRALGAPSGLSQMNS